MKGFHLMLMVMVIQLQDHAAVQGMTATIRTLLIILVMSKCVTDRIIIVTVLLMKGCPQILTATDTQHRGPAAGQLMIVMTRIP